MKFKKIAAAVLAAAVLAISAPITGVLTEPLGVTANAADTLTEGDYSYTVNEDGESVTITKYTGSDAEVDIPGTLGGKTVTKIGESAFEDCESLTSVTIPNGVTTIDYFAFRNCTSLVSVTIPDGVMTIEYYAFIDCTSLTSITIPDSVTTIGSQAFMGCTSLESITIPKGVTKIAFSAFYGCTSLTSVTIHDSVTEIGTSAFQSCEALTSVVIPDSVTVVGEQAFCGCASLTSIIIPESVTEIGSGAFHSCTSLTSVIISDGVTKIDEYPFGNCTSLQKIEVNNANKNFCSVDGILFNKDKTELVCYPAKKGETSYTIPNSVTTICSGAFACCALLTSVTIPDNVKSIGVCAFANCTSLTNVTIPNGVTETIGFFSDCRSLTSVAIPNSVTKIGDSTFMHCYLFTTIIYNGTKTEWAAVEISELNNEPLTNAEIICTDGIINEREPETSEPDTSDTSEPTSSDTSEPTTSDTSEPTSSDTSEPTSSDTSEPTTSDTSEPTSSDTSEPTSSDTSEPTSSDTSEPTSSDTSEPTSSDTSEPTSSDTSEPTSSDTSEPTSSDTSEPTSSDTSEPTSGDTHEPEELLPGAYFVDGGLEYTVLKDGTLEIRGFAGDEAKNIVIPETVKGRKVTSIGDAAFMDCATLTSVTLPSSVTNIGGYAFSGCTSLDTVNYGGTKSDWEAIDIDIENEAFTNAEIKCTDGIINEREPETSEPATSDTSNPTDPDLFIKENEVSTEIEVPSEAADIPESDRITSITINPAFNMKNKNDNNVELDLSKITIKAEEIYDKEGLKRAEEALGETIKGNKHYNLLDLTLLYNGEDFSNGYDGLVKVIIPLPKGHRDKNFSCFRLTEVDGKMVKEVIPGEQTEDSYIIYLEHFSLYALVADPNPDNGEEPENSEVSSPESPAVSDSDTTTAVPSDTTSGSSNPSTGIAMAIAPVMVVATIAAVAAKKKK